MSLLFARQPIFDKNNNIYGYELLYRDQKGKEEYDCHDGDVATSNVMAAGFLSMGVGEIAGKRKAFINFTHNMILQKVATLFPKDQIVVEILENVEPDKEIIVACKSLKQHGYTIALDDFIFRPGYEPLIEIADIIKVDFLLTKTESERRYILKQYGNGRISFLAEKIETNEELEMAIKIGYSYFQGYFFAKPVIISSTEIAPSKINHIKLMQVLGSEEPGFNEITSIIEKDVAFSYQILRIANTTYYYRGNEIKSIRQAAVRMGLNELKKWAFITVLRKVGGNNKDSIVNISAQRAKALEIISQKVGNAQRKMEYFTLGIMSMIDVIVGCPMELALNELNVSNEIKGILSGKAIEGKMAECFKLLLSYEKGEWNYISAISDKLSIQINDVAEAYYDAIVWSNNSE